MVNDEQTHRLPESDADRARVAALDGQGDLRRFDRGVERILKSVNRRYGELFAEDEPLSSRFGSLVFTASRTTPRPSPPWRAWASPTRPRSRRPSGPGITAGSAPPAPSGAASCSRVWRRGSWKRRGATGAPDAAFNRFVSFFGGLSSGVQVQSLFLAQPSLFELIVGVMAFAPQLAATLARNPAVLDALFDPSFFTPLGEADAHAIEEAAAAADGFEAAMDAVRRVHREQSFRVGVQIISGTATARDAGEAFASLADSSIRGLAPAALAETERLGGGFPGEVAVVALGKCGSREMTARSDLDLMTLYRPADGAAASALKGWSAETFYARFTQRLVAALSAPTAEGCLYQVDLQLRPSGTAGPVAVSLKALETYYQGAAETWEFLALTRARIVWASSGAFAATAAGAIEAALRRPRDPAKTARDVREMRALMERERPPSGFWDLKLSPGGLVDVEFAAQHLEIVHAARAGRSTPTRPWPWRRSARRASPPQRR